MNADRLLFVHVPRTGGQSIRAALGLDEPLLHLTAREHLRRLGELANTRVRFTVVRNPWDRAVSMFAFLHRSQPYRITRDGFRAWIDGGLLHPCGKPATLYAGTPYAIDVTAPQVRWIDGMHFDRIIRFEDLERGFGRLVSALGWDVRLEHRNGVTRSAPPAAFYDAETLEYVGELYREDVELSGAEGPTS